MLRRQYYFSKLLLHLTHLSRFRGVEVAPFLAFAKLVAKVSTGHIPQPFLISDVVKNWCKDIITYFNSPNFFCFGLKQHSSNLVNLQPHPTFLMDLPKGKNIYFASDFHLGIPDKESSLAREKRICKWLDEIRGDAAVIYLVGDLFDAWFEYRKVIPRGYTRFLGKLAELRDAGLQIEVFSGNHDLWMRDYFEAELNIPVHHDPIERTFNNKKFLIAHGDGLGPGDYKYKFLKSILRNPLAQWLYRRLHPDTGISIAEWFSGRGPKHLMKEQRFLGPEREWLIQFSLEKLKTEHVDYFIFGHRHIVVEYPLPGNSLFLNLGDWLRYDSYAVFDGVDLKLKYYKTK